MDITNQQITPAQNIPQDSMTNPPVSNQKGLMLPILGVAILLIIVAGGAYYLGTQKTNPINQPTMQDTTQNITPAATGYSPTTTSSSNLQTSENANWQTYSNTEIGYSIKYPMNWIINAWPVETSSIPKNTQSVNFGKYQLPSSFGEEDLKKEGYLVEVWIDIDKTLNQVLQENDAYKNRAGYKKEQTTFNGLTAYKIYNTGFDFPRDRMVFERNGKVFSIGLNYLASTDAEKTEAQKTYNLILDSFQFIK